MCAEADRSQVEQRRPQGTVRRHKHGRVLGLLRQGQELLAQCMRRLVLGTHVIIIPQSTQHGEKLVRIFQVLTEVPSTECRSVRLQEPRSLSWQSAMPQGDMHVHFSLEYAQVSRAASGVTPALDEVTDGFHMG